MALEDDVFSIVENEGRSLTIKKNTFGSYSPETSSGTVTASSVTAKGFLLDYHSMERDGERIKAGDRKAVIRAKNLSLAPVIGDLISDGSVDGQIVDIRRIEQKGSAITYICQLRY